MGWRAVSCPMTCVLQLPWPHCLVVNALSEPTLHPSPDSWETWVYELWRSPQRGGVGFIHRVDGPVGTGQIDEVEEMWRGNWINGHSRQETNFDAESHMWVVIIFKVRPSSFPLITFKLFKDADFLFFL